MADVQTSFYANLGEDPTSEQKLDAILAGIEILAQEVLDAKDAIDLSVVAAAGSETNASTAETGALAAQAAAQAAETNVGISEAAVEADRVEVATNKDEILAQRQSITRGWSFGNSPSAGFITHPWFSPVDVTFNAADIVGGTVGTNPGSDQVYDLLKNGVSAATITFTTAGGVTMSTDVTVVRGDYLRLEAPDPIDASHQSYNVNLHGLKAAEGI